MTRFTYMRCAGYILIALGSVLNHSDSAITMGCIILARIEILDSQSKEGQ